MQQQVLGWMEGWGGGEREREREEQIKHHCVAIGRDGHSTWCVFVLFFSLEVKVCCYVNGPFTSALDKRKKSSFISLRKDS